MERIEYLILGAGPAGLTVGNKLKEKGETNFWILEKENEAGGLCRSQKIDGSPLDIGGGHFLDVKRVEVNKFLFQFMPKEEWNLFQRDSRINIDGIEIGHPIEANIWQMKLDDQVEYLKSIALAGCNIGKKAPKDFVNWIFWKLGNKIAQEYMIPYNKKMFCDNLNELGTYWMEKLPNVSFEDTLRSCLTHKAYGKQPGHAQFYYPKAFGYGELWKRMAEKIKDQISYNIKICKIDFDNESVSDNKGNTWKYKNLIVSIPWLEFGEINGMPIELINDIQKLKYSSIDVRYFSQTLETDAHWIYCPDLNLPYHRILVRSNFCEGSKGFWTETNSKRLDLLCDNEKNNFHYLNKYAYPLNTIDKPSIMEKIFKWTKRKNVFGVGRWGEHQHYNSDVTVERAMQLVERLVER